MTPSLNYSALWLLLIPTLLCPPLWFYLLRRRHVPTAGAAAPATLPAPWMDRMFRHTVLACLTPVERVTLDDSGRRAVVSQAYCAMLCEDPQDGSSLDMDVLDAIERKASDYGKVPCCVGRDANADAIRLMAGTEAGKITRDEFYSRALPGSRRIRLLREIVRVFFADAQLDERLSALEVAVRAAEARPEAAVA